MTDITEPERLNGNWSYPTNIYFGQGRITELAELCLTLNIHKPLLVTDKGLCKQKFIANILNDHQLTDLNIAIFSDIKPNPSRQNVDRGVEAFKLGQHDGIIAVGGGSALDAGKAIGLMAGQSLPLWDFEDSGNNWQRVDTAAMAPVIAVPTTAGTGSEVGRAAVIVDETQRLKKIIFHPKMMPAVVLADPELTQQLPASLTAATGLDAFVHNLEAYCCPGYHPIADGIALEGLRLIKHWLPIAYANGNDLRARSHMLAASSMGAIAFQKGLGAVHALAHSLGALFDAHHGLLNAILLPYVLVQNRPAIEHKISHIARCLDCSEYSFNSFLSWVLEFRLTLEIPHTLKSIGIRTEERKLIGEMAAQDACAFGNPILFSAEQYSMIFLQAFNGELNVNSTS